MDRRQPIGYDRVLYRSFSMLSTASTRYLVIRTEGYPTSIQDGPGERRRPSIGSSSMAVCVALTYPVGKPHISRSCSMKSERVQGALSPAEFALAFRYPFPLIPEHGSFLVDRSSNTLLTTWTTYPVPRLAAVLSLSRS